MPTPEVAACASTASRASKPRTGCGTTNRASTVITALGFNAGPLISGANS